VNLRRRRRPNGHAAGREAICSSVTLAVAGALVGRVFPRVVAGAVDRVVAVWAGVDAGAGGQGLPLRMPVVVVLWVLRVLWACALYAFAYPANTASVAQTAIPVSTDFVMMVPSIGVQRARAVLRADAALQLPHLK
jgi:hypothetical protein